MTERLPKANYVKSNNKKNQSFTKKIGELPDITRVPKKNKKKEVNSTPHENEAPIDKAITQIIENKEEKKVPENQSLSPERKNKIENHDNAMPKKTENEDISIEEKKLKLKKNKDHPNLIIENSNPNSNRKQSLDNSLNDINDKENKKVALPNIKGYNKNDYEYQMKIDGPNIKKEKRYNHSLEKYLMTFKL